MLEMETLVRDTLAENHISWKSERDRFEESFVLSVAGLIM